MYKKGVIININSAILIAIFVLGSNLAIAEEIATNEQIKVLYDKSFDKEIVNVKLFKYGDNRFVGLYPKVVVLQELDKDLSQGDWRFYRKGVLFLDKEGNITARIPNLEYFSKVRVSMNGLLVAVHRRYIDKPSPYNPALMRNWERVKKEEVTVYNDSGEIVWQTDERLFPAKYDRYLRGISEKDTSIFMVYSKDQEQKFSPAKGFWIPPISPIVDKYPFEKCNGSLQGKFFAIAVYNPDRSQSVILLDSTYTPIWKQQINEQQTGQVKISPYGSYVFVWAYTWSNEVDTKEEALKRGRTILPKLVSVSTYLFDKKGNLIFKKNDKCKDYSTVFSDNEKYLAYRVGTIPVMVVTEIGKYKRLPITLPLSTITNPQMLISDNGILYIWHESVNEYELILVNVQGDIKGRKTFIKDEISGGIDEPKSNIVLINYKLYVRIIGRKGIRIVELISN